MFCMRTKVYDVKFDAPVVVEARRVGGSNEEFENNPMHLNSAGGSGNGGVGGKGNFDANPFSQQSSPSGGGGVEMSPPMPRVFNGDYRQLPVATDSD
jgi:hypothetical protein